MWRMCRFFSLPFLVCHCNETNFWYAIPLFHTHNHIERKRRWEKERKMREKSRMVSTFSKVFFDAFWTKCIWTVSHCRWEREAEEGRAADRRVKRILPLQKFLHFGNLCLLCIVSILHGKCSQMRSFDVHLTAINLNTSNELLEKDTNRQGKKPPSWSETENEMFVSDIRIEFLHIHPLTTTHSHTHMKWLVLLALMQPLSSSATLIWFFFTGKILTCLQGIHTLWERFVKWTRERAKKAERS